MFLYLKGSWNEFKKPEKFLENAIAKMILNKDNVNIESNIDIKKVVKNENIVIKNEQSTIVSENYNQHIKTNDTSSVYDIFKNIFFKKNDTIIETKKLTNEIISKEDSKNKIIEVDQIDNELVFTCLSDKLVTIFYLIFIF